MGQLADGRAPPEWLRSDGRLLRVQRVHCSWPLPERYCAWEAIPMATKRRVVDGLWQLNLGAVNAFLIDDAELTLRRCQ